MKKKKKQLSARETFKEQGVQFTQDYEKVLRSIVQNISEDAFVCGAAWATEQAKMWKEVKEYYGN